MIIIGHYAIKYEPFRQIQGIEEILHTSQNTIVWFDTAKLKEKGFEIAAHCYTHQIDYAVMIHSLEELLLYAALFPKYLILPKAHKAKSYQALLNHYLLDCKLLCVIKSNAQLTKIAQLGIDGVIFKQVLDTISSR